MGDNNDLLTVILEKISDVIIPECTRNASINCVLTMLHKSAQRGSEKHLLHRLKMVCLQLRVRFYMAQASRMKEKNDVTENHVC